MPGSGQLSWAIPGMLPWSGLDIVQPVGRDNKVMPGGGAHGVSISKVPWYTMRHKLQILLQQILAIFIHIWIWSTLCQSWTLAPDPGSKLHLHMWVYHVKSLLTRPLRVLNPCFPMLNKIAKFLHHFLRLRHRNPPRKSAAFCRYISNISNKLMRVVDWELFNFDID